MLVRLLISYSVNVYGLNIFFFNHFFFAVRLYLYLPITSSYCRTAPQDPSQQKAARGAHPIISHVTPIRKLPQPPSDDGIKRSFAAHPDSTPG
jgi:hypothetical protein